MGKFAAYLNAALALAWLALFLARLVGAASPTNMRDTKTYNVYRDDYTLHGHAVCASLQRLGGPPCPTRAEGVRIACDRVRERFRQFAQGRSRNKRCVPMTGKQQCERVPGGCTN